jgi:DNA mismatch repair protein MutS
VAGGERYTTPELDDLADRIEHAEARGLEREQELFAGLVAKVRAQGELIRLLAARLASWDVAAALADLAHHGGYCRPELDEGDALDVTEGRHAVVERYVAAGRFVPNDVRLDLAGERLVLLTGPNMAGKSTLMRQVAHLVILAQMGSFVPAARARVGLFDRVLSRVGASDDVARGESTFMVEMRETSRILERATRRSLVILDEIGRGTSTFDGLAIAWAVAEHLHDAVGCRAIFATHYHELTELARECSGVANYSVSAREHAGDIVFLHKLVKGPASKSYGVAVARLAGLPPGVLARAEALLAHFEGQPEPTRTGPKARARRHALPQLELFPPPARDPIDPVAAELRAELRELDPHRLTPLDALAIVSRLASRARGA